MKSDINAQDIAAVEGRVLEILHGLLASLGAERAIKAVRGDVSLERGLGLGSLERVELWTRLEEAFGLDLPEETFAEAETPRDLVEAIVAGQRANKSRSAATSPTVVGQSLPLPESAGTLVEVLRWYAEAEPERPHIYLQQEKGDEQTITYGDLFRCAEAVAGGLDERGIGHGDRVAIMLPTGESFFRCFFGVLLAGGVPVPIYPPFRADRVEEYARRQAGILENAGARMLITFREAGALARLLRPLVPTLTSVVIPQELTRPGTPFVGPDIDFDDPALIQYTSGSTGEPKGVLLLHRNLLANIRTLGQALKIRPDDVVVSWLPLYHDMGLIGAWLTALYFGFPAVILSPLSFLSRPERWLWAIHAHRATLSPAPNFAYELCARRVSEAALEGLDLSSWRVALNGAEPVSPDTVARFTERFGGYGFKPEAMLPVYGLAESSVALVFPPVGREPFVDCIARKPFESDGRAEAASPSERSPLRFVSVGRPLPGHQVRIVDEEGQPVPERCQGRLHFRGPSSMVGYYGRPEATRAVMRDGWIDSGDLAYSADEELFVTGRHKDLIIKAGRNLYPQEIEEVAGEVEGVRKGCVAAFGVPDPLLGTERIVVVAETREGDAHRREEIQRQIAEQVVSVLEVPPDIILLVPPGTVSKTSSGKIRRSACREAYLQGKLEKHRRAASVQIARLWLQGLGPRLRRLGRQAVFAAYGLYLALAILATALPVWGLLALLPQGRSSARLVRGWARLILFLSGCPLTVEGFISPAKSRPLVFVANHASYIDAVVLIAALPADIRFVGKREILRWPAVGTALRKAGHLAVEREETARAVSEAQRIEEVLRDGFSLAFFPEGTFTAAAGLRPFRLGAFKIASATGRPICPVTIRGTRRFLPDRAWLPRWSRFHVVFGPLLKPQGTTWEEAVRLRDKAREEISRHCGEPRLELMDASVPRG